MILICRRNLVFATGYISKIDVSSKKKWRNCFFHINILIPFLAHKQYHLQDEGEVEEERVDEGRRGVEDEVDEGGVEKEGVEEHLTNTAILLRPAVIFEIAWVCLKQWKHLK